MSERPPADDGESALNATEAVAAYKPLAAVLVGLAVVALAVANPPVLLALASVLPQLVVAYLLYRLVKEVARVADALE